MKKIIVLFLLFISISQYGYSQAAVVNDPINTVLNTASNTIATISQTITNIMATTQLTLLDNAVFNNLSTVMEIVDYIDQIACQTSELKFNYRYAKSYSCLTMLNMKSVTMNINYTTTLISKLFLSSSIITMTKEARFKALSDILVILKDVSNQLAETNTQLTSFGRNRVANRKQQEALFQLPKSAIGTRYNIQCESLTEMN